jgi:UDP-N-acetylmuramoyl-tripeptide--D-alanyl-D-alanine ligase
VKQFSAVARGAVLTFGFAAEAQFRAEKIEDRGAEGSTFDFVWPGGRARLALLLPGRHNISNALGALAAASVWGIGAPEAAAVFPELLPGEMRGRLLRFADGFALINDSYNSNPLALEAMTELLARTPGYRRRILAAGQMLELGPDSPRLHREAGLAAASLNLDILVAVKGDAADIAAGAIEGGLPAGRVHFFATSSDAAAFLSETIAPGDLVLVKGSRGVKMERIVDALRARHALSESAETPAASPGNR